MILSSRAWLVALALLLLSGSSCSSSGQELPGWQAWKHRFLMADGRVVASLQDNISTSEGQGYGMLLSVSSDNDASFARIWGWTQKHLGTRADGLFAWRWLPDKGTHTDHDDNDAADGDLLIAWALEEAGNRFHKPDYTDASRHIAKAIRMHLIKKTAWGEVIRPAVQGFDKPQGLVVNLSYWVFPAFTELNRIDPSPQWAALTQSGLRLLSIAHYGHWGLPPDWLILKKPLGPAPGWLPRYGYDAVRIPLYLYWAGLATQDRTKSFRAFWAAFSPHFTPAWAALDQDVVSAVPASIGIMAIRQLLLTDHPPASSPVPLDKQQYYSATLWLLAHLASH